MYRPWARRIERIERNIDRAASAMFAAACGYAGFVWLRFSTGRPLLAAETAAIAVFSYLLSVRVLGSVKPAVCKAPVPIFNVRDVEPIETTAAPEQLEEAVSVEATPAEDASPTDAPPMVDEQALVLNDILAALEPDSRVVRLFDPAAMPTAGELKSRIDRHLDDEAAAAQSFDAAQALHEALAELRRSIR